MAMNVSSGGSSEPMCDVNTTPLIDVMLVLLVMLILTLPVQNHAVKLEMPPPSTNAVQDNPERIYVEIDPDGTVVINGSAMSGIPAIEEFFNQESVKEPQPEIHLRPSGLALYDVVANVMAAAQRAGMVRMGFTNVAEFAE
ncbi:MAG TPA: biopolymer transporter ExbD [Steroidobacteraceae bacterium]|nr:biopolymer transporter ExbD [Steroidobacteraceae bacterium]